jgi:DNA-directed RNA polymerase specialized sigma24 family protein
MTVDDVEFREFFAAQYARLCWLGLLLTGDQTEAEELAQEVLVLRFHEDLNEAEVDPTTPRRVAR